MAPKKGGKKGGKKKKKEPEWGEIPRELFVNLEVRNSAWQSMRFVECVSTAQPLDAVRALIVAKHIAPREAEVGVNFRLFRGAGCDDDALFEPSDYAMSLAELQIVGGSKNDGVHQVVTYEYAPFESILGLPRSGLVAPPLSPGTSLSYRPSNPEAAAAAVKAAALTATY